MPFLSGGSGQRAVSRDGVVTGQLVARGWNFFPARLEGYANLPNVGAPTFPTGGPKGDWLTRNKFVRIDCSFNLIRLQICTNNG